MGRAWRLAVAAVATVGWASCRGAPVGERGAEIATDGTDAGGGRDGGATLSWVDITVSGCPQFDPAGPTCGGSAPRELRFSAIAPAAPQSYLWSFGDGTAAVSEPAPRHRFTRPGRYTVSLTVGGPAGTVQASRDMFVVLTSALEGEECAVGRGCVERLACICPSGCPGLIGPGFCAASCDASQGCGARQVCVDPGPRGGDDGWPASACLAGCTSDADCGPARRCRDLPAAAPAAGWVRGCFPLGLLGDEGAACRDGGGALDDARCLGRDCADLGARGLCAAECDGAHPCPTYASCVTFTSGARRCLARCTADRTCGDDPFLGCEAPDSSGTLGFSAPAGGGKLCAPRRCGSDAECGPDGKCRKLGTASFCGQKSPG